MPPSILRSPDIQRSCQRQFPAAVPNIYLMLTPLQPPLLRLHIPDTQTTTSPIKSLRSSRAASKNRSSGSPRVRRRVPGPHTTRPPPLPRSGCGAQVRSVHQCLRVPALTVSPLLFADWLRDWQWFEKLSRNPAYARQRLGYSASNIFVLTLGQYA